MGHPEDETGLVYMRARYYEPTTGRFVSEDPARDGVNWYLYADGDPVGKVDFTGKFVGAIIGALFGLVFGMISAWASGQSTWQIIGAGFAGMLAGGLGGLISIPAVAGFVTAFVGSILNDLLTGGLKAIDLKKALLAGITGGAFGGICGWILNKMGRAVTSWGVSAIADDVDDGLSVSDNVVGALVGVSVDGTFNFIYN